MNSILLEDIIDEINQLGVVYNIHYCNAGVGFIMYYEDSYSPVKNRYGGINNHKEGLSVETYYDNIRLAAEATLQMLKDKGEMSEPEILRDKFGKKIQHNDIMKVNPDDDAWLNLVTTHKGRLLFVSEIEPNDGRVPLRDVLQHSDNPAIIEGNLNNNRLEFYKW